MQPNLIKELAAKSLSRKIEEEKSSYTALYKAIVDGRMEIARVLLINMPADQINKQTSIKRSTALLQATKTGDIDLVGALLSKRADPTLADNRGRTPISIAAERGFYGIAMVLLINENPKNIVNNLDSNGNTPILIAAREGLRGDKILHFDIIKLLLDKGATAQVKETKELLEEKLEVLEGDKKGQVEQLVERMNTMLDQTPNTTPCHTGGAVESKSPQQSIMGKT